MGWKTLLKSGKFALLSKRKFAEDAPEVIIINVIECETERPKKKEAYSGKKKRHKFKAQVLITGDTGGFLCVSFALGHVHDFTI